TGVAHRCEYLRAGFLNVNSLRARIERLRLFLAGDSTYHVFGIAETWLGPVVDDHIVSVPGYSVVRGDRNINGGGVALYIRDHFRVKKLASSATQGPGKPGIPEYLFCSVETGNSPPVLVGVIYRPPRVPFQLGSDLFDVLRDLCDGFSHKIIMGDLNADMTSRSDDALTITRLGEELSLGLVQHGPTHHVGDSHTWLDIIMTDDCDTIRDHNTELLPSFGKHAVIDVTIDIYAPSPVRECYTYRNLRGIRPECLANILGSMDWASAESVESDLEGAICNLSDNLTEAINILAPEKKICPKKKYAPWFGPELRRLVDERDALHRRYKRTGREDVLREFLKLGNEVDVRIEQERTNFLQDHLSSALENGKNIWREMRNLGLLPGAREDGLHGFGLEELNDHFAGVSVSTMEDVDGGMGGVDGAGEEGFTFKPVSVEDVILAVSHFSSQACGVDGIPHGVVAKALPVIAEHLRSIFNSSFARGVFPGAWKRAQLIALKKSNAPSSASDFRPIALLCFLSKLLEKLAHDQITEYINKEKLLDPLQAGFRRNHSTQTALLKLTDDIRLAIDKKRVTLLLLFDFSKAFDTISPSKLLRKLRDLGFSGSALSWLRSYLQGRTQRVTSGGESSAWRETNLGVPQGSVLGPLLFCLYVNDLKDVLKGHEVSHLFYADDLQIYLHIPKNDLTKGISILTETARLVAGWACDSDLRLNAGKTKAIVFGTNKDVNDIYAEGLPGIEVQEGVCVPFSEEVVSLGVVLDCKLNWRAHIDRVAKKVRRALYGLRFVRPCTTELLRRRLTESLVQPHLDYCAVLCLGASAEQRERIQRLSNACVRYIFGIPRDGSISPFRAKLGWLRT
ncbi:hypothetical protein KM043_000050, partial [Ampulex compressa]